MSASAKPSRLAGGRSRRRALVVATCLFVLAPLWAEGVTADPAPSTTVAPDQAQAARESAEKKKADLLAQLDVLHASDEQLNAELLQIDDRLNQQQARVHEAEQGRASAEAQLGELDKQVTEAQRAADEAEKAAAERAVTAYIRPDRETASEMLAARDPQALGKMHVLITHVAEYDHSVVLSRQTAQYLLAARKAEVDETRRKADEFAKQADADLREVADLKVAREAVHNEVSGRIDEVKGEAEALDRQEAQLTALIAQQHAAAPPSTTTTAPATTTTTAAPTTLPPKTVPGAPPTTKPPTTTTTAAPPTTKPPTGPGKSLSWPVSGPINSGFGPRWGTFHKGLDIGAGQGTPIHAAADGVVFFSGVMDGYGNVILIDHGNGIVTLYAHQSQLIAGVGQRVSRGQTIGLVGSTGHSTGPHLHFEVRVNGVAYDPLAYLA